MTNEEKKIKIICLIACVLLIVILTIINSIYTDQAVNHCINEGQDSKICEQLRN